MSTGEEDKREVVRLIRQSEEKGLQITGISRELVQLGQRQADFAGASKSVVQYVEASGINWQPTMDAWQYVNDQQDAILSGLRPIHVAPYSTSGSAVAYAMAPFAKPSFALPLIPADKADQARLGIQRLGNEISMEANKNDVLLLMRSLGLSAAWPGQSSPIGLFETAWAVYGKPAEDKPVASASLIPMRECVNAVIAQLIRRRPKQEKTSSESAKVSSIGEQLAHSSITPPRIASMATRWGSLSDALSGSKQRDMPREEWLGYLLQATLWLKELLQSLDPARFRQ